jgi:hypothetical protein
VGGIHQYNDFHYADWHGDSVSEYAFGVEHTGDGESALTVKQLDASAALFAAIVEMTKDIFGETIPLVKVPRVSVANYRIVKGFWDHTDVDNGPLNENGHVDHLIGRSWADQIAKIKGFLAAAGPAFPGTLLRLGVDDPAVIVWKRRMAVKGFFNLRDSNNGPHFGSGIEAGTKHFQEKVKLPQDGVVGPKTWNAAWA